MEEKTTEIRELLKEWMNEELYQVILSNPREEEKGSKVKIRPVIIKEQLLFQETLYQGTKVLHSNHEKAEVIRRIEAYLQGNFRQGELQSAVGTVTVLVSKKGKMTVNVKRRRTGADGAAGGNGGNLPQRRLMGHNRVKNYILEEGKPVDFLVGLGVQTKDGRVVKAKYDKFRQINRYLEFIEDVIPMLPSDKPLRIIDFGCGKSYLTFAMYYYLHTLKKYPVEITGLDLKTDVIERCNALAKEYGYTDLHFERGDISTYEGTDQVDMVVTLHACDTATDYAIEKAVRWGAQVILAVPCCQHEVNRQISCEPLEQILNYGLIKERMSALITDAVRANLLEEMGYDTQILEFIDMEHTPKNLLIRAVKRKGIQKRERGGKRKPIAETCDFLNIQTTLQMLFKQEQ